MAKQAWKAEVKGEEFGERMGERVKASRETMRDWANRTAIKIQTLAAMNASGKVLKRDTNELANAIVVNEATDDDLTAEVGIEEGSSPNAGPSLYGPVLEHGATIVPKTKGSLVFEIKGECVFAPSVTIPPRPWFWPAVDEVLPGAAEDLFDEIGRQL